MWNVKRGLVVFLLCFATVFGGLFPKKRIISRQSATYRTFWSQNALDDDLKSFSVAMDDFVNPKKREGSWWEGDLGKVYYVTHVELGASFDPYHASLLKNIHIRVGPSSITNDFDLRRATWCYYWPMNKLLSVGQTEKIACLGYNFGKYVLINKFRSVRYNDNFLSISEVAVYVSRDL